MSTRKPRTPKPLSPAQCLLEEAQWRVTKARADVAAARVAVHKERLDRLLATLHEDVAAYIEQSLDDDPPYDPNATYDLDILREVFSEMFPDHPLEMFPDQPV